MLGWRLSFGFVLVMTAVVSTAQVEARKVPIRYTSPFSGDKMYASYCAVCHGDNGKGDGPAAAAMTPSLRDLTTLSKSNSGKFPRTRVFFAILNGKVLPQGEQDNEMPGWAEPFFSMCVGQRGCGAEVQMRVVRLTDYLESLQSK